MSPIAINTYGANKGVILDGSGNLCIGCCNGDIVATNINLYDDGPNRAAASFAGESKWYMRTFLISNRTIFKPFKTSVGIYYATETGILVSTLGGVIVTQLVSHLLCFAVCVDSSGGIYIAHQRYGGKTVTKINGSGDVQWTYDTGDTVSAICLDYDEARVLVARGVVGNNDCLFSLVADDGAEEWTADQPSGFGVSDCLFDIAGNAYGSFHNWSGSNNRLRKYDSSGGLVWMSGGYPTFGGLFGNQIATDNVYIYLHRSNYIISALNVSDATFIWNESTHGGVCLAVSAVGRLFVAAGGMRELDPSNGNLIWELSNSELWGTAQFTYQIHAGDKPGTLPWACSNDYIAGDIVENDDVIYECILAHTSCDLDDEPGVGAVWETYWVAA